MKLDAVEIEQITGYKAPLSLLDKIIEVRDNESITAKSNINMNEPFFKGHFPDNPVMPGVYIIQAMVEAIQVLNKKRITLKKIHKARFRKMVVPGDQLIIKVNKNEKTNGYQANAFVKDELACSAELDFS